jgi:hypothetical protein
MIRERPFSIPGNFLQVPCVRGLTRKIYARDEAAAAGSVSDGHAIRFTPRGVESMSDRA